MNIRIATNSDSHKHRHPNTTAMTKPGSNSGSKTAGPPLHTCHRHNKARCGVCVGGEKGGGCMSLTWCDEEKSHPARCESTILSYANYISRSCSLSQRLPPLSQRSATTCAHCVFEGSLVARETSQQSVDIRSDSDRHLDRHSRGAPYHVSLARSGCAAAGASLALTFMAEE